MTNTAALTLSLISKGKANAIALSRLAAITGQTSQAVKQAILEAHESGTPICSSQDGYFMPSALQEAVEYYSTQLYWKSGSRKKRVNHSSVTQQKANEKHSKRHFLQLINGNFENNDYFVTCSYFGEVPEREEVKRELQRFLNRLRTLYQKHGIEFKYIAVIEQGEQNKRLHIHLIVLQGVTVEEIKKRWKQGLCDVRRLFGGDKGDCFGKLAQYLTKNRPVNGKRWTGSKNLKQPVIQRIFESISKALYAAIFCAVISNDSRSLAAIVKHHIGEEYTFTDCEMAENPAFANDNIYFKLWKGAPLMNAACSA